MSRCCGYQGLCQTWVTRICRQRSPNCCCVSFVACWTQQDSGLQALAGTGDVPSLKEEIPLARIYQDPENHCALGMAPCSWSTASGRTEPAQRHRDSPEHPLHPLLSDRLMCRALDENIAQRWKAKATSVLWVCDTTATQWTSPKKVKLGGTI